MPEAAAEGRDRSQFCLLATHAGRLSWARRFGRDLDRLEELYLGQLMSTHDAVEGIRAFLERRDPAWQDE